LDRGAIHDYGAPNKTPLQNSDGLIVHGSTVRPLPHLPRRGAAKSGNTEYFPTGQYGEHHPSDEPELLPALTPVLPCPVRT
jgi:hypothetical protein